VTLMFNNTEDESVYGILEIADGAGSVRDALFFSNSEEGEDGRKVYKSGDVVTLNVFREGTFRHPWYGDLNFTKDYLQAIITNFNIKACAQRPAGNIDHNTSHGSLAWVEQKKGNLFMERRKIERPTGTITRWMLFCRATLTGKGAEEFNDNKYRYISSEIHPNYTNREKYSQKRDGAPNMSMLPYGSYKRDEKDNDKYQIFYGPTFTGFAFTNDPFIPELQQSFSNGTYKELEQLQKEGCEIEMSVGIGQDTDMLFFTRSPMRMQNTPPVDTQEEVEPPGFDGLPHMGDGTGTGGEEPPQSFNEPNGTTPTGDTNMSFIMQFNQAMAAQVDDAARADVAEDFAIKAEKEEDRAYARSQKNMYSRLAAMASEKANLTSQLEGAQAVIATKDEALAANAATIQSFGATRVELSSKSLHGDLVALGMPPAVCDFARDFVAGLEPAQLEQKFCAGGEETVDVAGLVVMLCQKLPKEIALTGPEGGDAHPVVIDGGEAEPTPNPEPGEQGENKYSHLPENVQKYVAKYGEAYCFAREYTWSQIDEDGEYDPYKTPSKG